MILIITILFLCNILFIYKYLQLKKGIKSYNRIGTGRYGFYKYTDGRYSFYNAYVYVYEMDRYTDGFSRIEIDTIEAISKNHEKDSSSRARNEFLSLKLYSEIEWLESEDHIKKLRKEKLAQINKI